MSECDVNSPIDLSRRSDSVETRKTPSPYNTSSFTETSPSLEMDSPSSLHFRKNSLFRSDTPTNRYHSSAFKPINGAKIEHITPTPPESSQMHQQYQLLQDSNHIEMNSYLVNTELSAQRKYPKASMLNRSSSSEAKAPITLPYSTELRTKDKKSTRPFKIYSKDPLGLTATIPSSMDQFHLFRQQALNQLYASGELTIPMKRPMSQKSYDGSEQSEMDYHEQNDGENKSDSSSSNGKGIIKDAAYYERRRKNNVAAKKSRDRRRLKESELVIRAAFLQRENYQLKYELDAVKRQLERFIAV